MFRRHLCPIAIALFSTGIAPSQAQDAQENSSANSEDAEIDRYIGNGNNTSEKEPVNPYEAASEKAAKFLEEKPMDFPAVNLICLVNRSTNAMSLPSDNTPAAGKTRRGLFYQFLNATTDNKWVKISLGKGQVGWVKRSDCVYFQRQGLTEQIFRVTAPTYQFILDAGGAMSVRPVRFGTAIGGTFIPLRSGLIGGRIDQLEFSAYWHYYILNDKGPGVYPPIGDEWTFLAAWLFRFPPGRRIMAGPSFGIAYSPDSLSGYKSKKFVQVGGRLRMFFEGGFGLSANLHAEFIAARVVTLIGSGMFSYGF